jgi:peptidoglycan hydrolase-like protein with peptidoglycan-binding domain
VAEYQATHGITPTGILDDATRAAITRSHDSLVSRADEDVPPLEDDKFDQSATLPKDSVT